MKIIFIIIGIFCLLNLNAYSQPTFSVFNSPPGNIYCIVTDPITTTDLYACTASNVLHSNDNGVSWSKTKNPGGTVNVLYIYPSGTLYAGTTSGIYTYNKPTDTWTTLSGSPLNVTALIEFSGNLYAGTGTTGNVVPNPINYGTGVYKFIAPSSWAAINTNMPTISNSKLPYIKAFAIVSGEVVAATYGDGVLKYSGSAWATYGTGLSNLYANCLVVNSSGTLFAGTDIGISSVANSAAPWSANIALVTPNKPVRTLAISSSKIYAGLGFYHYQKGSVGGEIFSSTNTLGTVWLSDGSSFNSTGVSGMAVHSNGTVFAVACGIWSLTGGVWSPSFSLNGISVSNTVYQLVKNSKGDLFAMCTNLNGDVLGYGGLFRSTNNGISWVSVNTGINCLGLSVLYVDNKDNLWVGGRQFTGLSLNPVWTNPELYRSIDNGANWVRNTSILTPSANYAQIAEAPNGKIYVTNSFGQQVTNISSTLNGINFDNTLNPPSTPNGDKAYGLGITQNNYVHLGTETAGIMSSINNGASFISITPVASNPATFTGTGPLGNNGVDIDPYTGNLCSGGTHGYVNGVQTSNNFWGVTAANINTLTANGPYMFSFNQLPAYTALGNLIFTRVGIYYGIGANPNLGISGLYFSDGSFNSNTNFTRVLTGFSIPTTPPTPLSYNFSGMMTDDCGYLYGANGGGGGIYKSNAPIDAPGKCNLVLPADNTQTSLTPMFTWAHNCGANLNYTIQIATDAAFTSIIKTVSNLNTASYAYTGSPALANGTTYYWRVNAVNTTNSLGSSLWSKTYNFTANAVLPIKLLKFTAAKKDNTVELKWSTAYEINNNYFTVDRSADGVNFEAIATINGAGNSSSVLNYSSVDTKPYKGTSYYRLKQTDINGKVEYSNIIPVNFNKDASGIDIFPNPNTGKFIVEGAEHSSLIISNSVGAIVLQQKINAHAEIDLSHQTNGTYFIKIIGENKYIIKKVVINH